MGTKDTITKDYMADNRVFTDVFNHMLYKGKNIIDHVLDRRKSGRSHSALLHAHERNCFALALHSVVPTGSQSSGEDKFLNHHA